MMRANVLAQTEADILTWARELRALLRELENAGFDSGDTRGLDVALTKYLGGGRAAGSV